MRYLLMTMLLLSPPWGKFPEHANMRSAIPPEDAGLEVVGDIKGMSATHQALAARERKRNLGGQHFWGHEGSSCPRQAGMRKPCGTTSGTRSRKTNG